MKKTILLAIITFSLNVIAESKHLSSNYFKSKDNKAQILSEITPRNNSVTSLEKPRRTPTFMIQKPDSIRQWSWDINTSGWINDAKTVDMLYDANNNLKNRRDMIWNETVWENDIKIEMQYDGFYPLSTLTQNWKNNNWENYMLNSTFYTASNQTDSTKTEMWMGGTWKKISLYIFTYDLSNRMKTLQMENNYGPFTSKSKVTYSYDTNNNSVTEYNQIWYVNDWLNSSWIDYTYTAQNKIKSRTEKKWINNDWQYSKSNTYEYDLQGNTTNTIYLTWNGSTWYNISQNVSTYNLQNDQTSELYQTWNGTTWVDEWKYIWEYEGNNLKFEISQELKGGLLTNDTKTIYTYVGQDNVAEELNQIWDGTTWIDESHLLNMYDGNFNLLKEMDQKWNGTAWINSRTLINTYSANNNLISVSEKYWDTDGITVTSGDSTQYYFSEASVRIKEISSTNISLFPNPTTGKFKIMSSDNIKELEITNLMGESVYNSLGINNSSLNLDVTNYLKGIYVVRIKTETETVNRKIIVR